MVSDVREEVEQAFRDLNERFASLSNWGRWGSEDELGTVNFVSDESRAAAAKAVTTGKVFHLGIPVADDGPQAAWTMAVPRTNPIHIMTKTGLDDGDRPGAHFADDALFLPLQAGTQWDALGHAHFEGRLYNGFPASTITMRGLERNSIYAMKDRLAGRGVLIDIARFKKVEVLEPGYAITIDDLESACAAQSLEVRTGDFLMIRTGWLGAFRAGRISRAEYMKAEPGLALECLQWLADHEIAAVAADNVGIEVVPAEDPQLYFPFHLVAIVTMGLTLGEMFALDDLAADCDEDGRYEFLFVGPPLAIPGAAGSPTNPLVIK